MQVMHSLVAPADSAVATRGLSKDGSICRKTSTRSPINLSSRAHSHNSRGWLLHLRDVAHAKALFPATQELKY
jgi:hypothetical protein